MKILQAQEIREADAYTIAHEPVASIDLMERAAKAFVQKFIWYISDDKPVSIICGTGNNGGDGLAIARILIEKEYQVNCYVIIKGENTSDDFKTNYERLKKVAPIGEITENFDIPRFRSGEVIIDAIFGSGLTRPVSGIYGEVIKAINNSETLTVSVDIASGLPVDQPAAGEIIIKPAVTISFQVPKPAFFIPENEAFTGKWEIVNIGLDQEFIDHTKSVNFMITRDFIRSQLKERKKFSHKGNYGRALIISGSYGKMGAAVLCAKACLRSGVGLLTMHIPKCGYEIMQSSIPEAMASIDRETSFITGYPDLENYNTVAIGPGIGMQDQTVGMIGKLLENYIYPLVIDADALNIIARNNYLMEKIPQKSIFTPHVREFERIAGRCENHYERLDKQRKLSRQYGLVIILKGAYTSISLPDGKMYFNTTGNPGMATGGAGDALTGIITGLLAQEYTPATAAILGVYLHGLAGDIAVENKSQEGLIASDIIEALPQAFLSFR